MASLASAVAIFEPFLAFVLLSNARFVLFCLISFALRATPEKRVCLRFRLAIYVFSLSLGETPSLRLRLLAFENLSAKIKKMVSTIIFRAMRRRDEKTFFDFSNIYALVS